MSLNRDFVTVVSGLPRSGTSMMMQALEAGGMSVLSDGERTADVDNLRGYYEYEKVKSLAKDNTWLKEAEGMVVKIISMLLYKLDQSLQYKVVFMTREMGEILASQDTQCRFSK